MNENEPKGVKGQHVPLLEDSAEEVTDYAVSTTFTYQCAKCQSTVSVVEGVVQSHDCN